MYDIGENLFIAYTLEDPDFREVLRERGVHAGKARKGKKKK